MGQALLAARGVLCLVFVVAGLAKLFDLPGAQQAVTAFGVPERLARPVSVALPVLELGISLALVPLTTAWWGALTALCVLVLFIAAIGRSMHRGQAPDCHCFGQLHSAPAGPSTLARNAVLAAAAAFVVAHGPRGPAGTSATTWVGRLSAAELLAVVALVVAAAVAVAAAALALSLLRAHGRLLVRIDQLQSALAGVGAAAPRPQIDNGNGAGAGLPIGTRAPEFELQELDGEKVNLGSLLRSRLPVVLVFTDPACGPCKQALALVAQWQRQYAGQVEIAVVSGGDLSLMRSERDKLGLARVLVEERHDVAKAYASYGTPAAVLISSEGFIGSAVQSGPNGIHQVLERALGFPVPVPNQKGSANEAPRVAIGNQAPNFELRTVSGGTVSAEDLRGTETVLLFWNPNCGFCDKMKPDVQAWWGRRAPEGPQLLVVSSGSAEDNGDLGPGQLVVLDQDFMLASRFGATGTPMGVLLDADGRIASGVAAGASAVFGLLRRTGRPLTTTADG